MDYTDLFMNIQRLRKQNHSGIVAVRTLKEIKNISDLRFWENSVIVIFFSKLDSILCFREGDFILAKHDSQEAKDFLHSIEDQGDPYGIDDIGYRILSGPSEYKWYTSAPFSMNDVEFGNIVIEKFKEYRENN